jgi:L-lactate dehydrogenase complex protein LldG
MSERAAILAGLRAARPGAAAPAVDFSVIEEKRWEPRERVERLVRAMGAVKTEFLEAGPGDWPQAVVDFVLREQLPNLLYGPGTAEGRALAAAWPARGPRLEPYDRPVESFKQDLFEGMAAGFTTTLGGIAETGGLLLAPGPAEPRLLSLVPPVHLALLRTDRIFDTLLQAFRELGWTGALPANALVISGPSKTADIEQTLAYGVHGPKRLMVLLVPPEPSGTSAQGLAPGPGRAPMLQGFLGVPGQDE